MIVDLPLPAFRLGCGLSLPGLHVRVQALGPGTDALKPWQVAASSPGPQVVTRTREGLEALWASAPPPRLDASVPTVLVVHALTGDAVAGGPGGWWEPHIGPGRRFDTNQTRVLCANLLGSCNGTFGASDPFYPRWTDHDNVQEGPAWRPAPLTTWDQARLLHLLLDALGIDAVDRVVGGSVGGMVALALAARLPNRVRAVDAIATDVVATPWVLGWNHVGRQATLANPDHGLALARQLAHHTYRADEGLWDRQGRRRRGDGPHAPFAMQTYLDHQGAKLVARFTPASYVAMLDTMDHHDLAEPPPDADPTTPWTGVGRLHHVRGIGLSTDRLFPPERLRAFVERIPGGSFHLVHNPHGHDAFLIDHDGIGAALDHPGAP